MRSAKPASWPARIATSASAHKAYCAISKSVARAIQRRSAAPAIPRGARERSGEERERGVGGEGDDRRQRERRAPPGAIELARSGAREKQEVAGVAEEDEDPGDRRRPARARRHRRPCARERGVGEDLEGEDHEVAVEKRQAPRERDGERGAGGPDEDRIEERAL